MFTTLGLFGDVPCPKGQQCALITCLFSHKDHKTQIPEKREPEKSLAPAADGQPVSKRARLGTTREVVSQVAESAKPSHLRDMPNLPVPSEQPERSSHDNPILQSVIRPVSPPPSARTASKPLESITGPSPARLPAALPARTAPKESLNPRMLTKKAPATHTVRSAILKKLHSGMSVQNEKAAKDKDRSKQRFVLTPDELVTMALDEEEKTARDNPEVYSNVIKLRIVKLTKMCKEDWIKEVMAHLNTRYYKTKPIEPSPKKAEPLNTGLSSKQEISIVPQLVTPLNGLEEFGYVTKAPTKTEIETSKKGVVESKGWEKCDRCGGRFQVFPGRREDGALASGGQCTYHPGKPIYPPRKQTDHITGSSEAYFPCCSETMGTSPGCTKANTHVFKVSEAKRLASILQFETTPSQPEKGALDPVCFDCEMGYTTLGLELIRLTAISWPEGNELLDVLVKPMGEVLDLNSRYSGVFPEHYASATRYTPDRSSSITTSKTPTTPLQVVESPAAARTLLFQFLQPETPLLGHAIDNDLNVCRIIHPTVIDTVLLYPHPRGRLPSRMSLKALARKFLGREIQTGGERGHDSKEDSLATGDLVRVKVAERWKRLEKEGWRFEEGRMVAPAALGADAGQKRNRMVST
ncbi:hypothetical protein N7510_011234 [Penicillium lagena]|uniref:uncharacterized protein n=1 Tax=Penicillium lagena TaxID=94218 RepID=UPI002541913E|nr:uncharacterized protein N7510_011234 [Penicillium lagena]KAJ5601700.1 hypothetical protein N7510_011234 [Penicillium lagena]